jgi:hypothetical protein
MILCFKLSMPTVGSWNGKWTGEGRPYLKLVNLGRTKKAVQLGESILAQGYFRYDFGDGWAAGITVKSVEPGEASKLKRKSAGFCGYEWMIDSIIAHGTIKT